MSRLSSAAGEFARRGFADAGAAARAWQRFRDAAGGETPLPLEALDVAANRDQALTSLAALWEADQRLVELIAADAGWLRRLLLVLGASDVLARYLVRHPEETELLRTAGDHRTEQGWRDFFADRLGPADGVATSDADALRRANHAALVEIAARDLSAADPSAVVDVVAAELAAVADAVLEHALALARAEVPEWEQVRLAVVAMGKTGARELNYKSDVDVIHVAEPVGEVSTDTAMQAGTRLAAALARVCSEHSAEGTIWEVDAALRPEGAAGPLVRTLESSRAYYARWAENWEFQALLKARPAAGDKVLGQAFCDMVAPKVWEAGQREGFLPQVRGMRQRVISLIPAKRANREIKLGPGGLRDVEFSVQLLQLVHGRADDRIRAAGTFEALDALVACGYIGRADGQELGQAYRFQRALEHRIQLRRLQRTHLFPEDSEALTQVARMFATTPDELAARWRSSARSVQRLQQRIFFSPLLDAVSTLPTDTLQLTPEAAQARMRALGFSDPRSALGHVKALTSGATRTAEIQHQLMPAMLGWFAEGPNPDFGLLAFRQLSDALGGTSWYLRALRDEGWMAQRLARVASSSRYVVDLLKRAPEMVRMLAGDDELRPRGHAELAEAMVKAAGRQEDTDKAVSSMRALRRAELCRIAIADVLSDVDIELVGHWLADLAAAAIDAALAIARRDINAPAVGVVAMGRWGGGELSYSSDADLMYVVDDDVGGEGVAAATELVRRAAELLGRPGPDPALLLDSDLRPEGRDGAQVRTVSSYRSYYERWAETWEAQALLRARPGAGNLELAATVVADVEALRYPSGGLAPSQVADIRRLKSRMESERIPRGVPKERHLKLGKGGLSDIEWTVQLLQLRHAAAHPELRTPSTLPALRALRETGLLGASDARDLRDAWVHISRLRDAITLVRGRPGDVLPSDSRELASIAEVMGEPGGQASQLLEETRRVMRRADKVVERVFWEG